MIASKTARDHGWMVAACAVALATAVPGSSPAACVAVGAAPASSAPLAERETDESAALRQMQRYCTTSWRNAGVPPQEWEDCTQQALVELLETLPHGEWSLALEQPESEARRELNRAVWRMVQRSRRQPRVLSLQEDLSPAPAPASAPAEIARHELWRLVDGASRTCLTPRQQIILELSRDGWKVAEIAAELRVTPERVSDEKYKAIHRLRATLGAIG